MARDRMKYSLLDIFAVITLTTVVLAGTFHWHHGKAETFIAEYFQESRVAVPLLGTFVSSSPNAQDFVTPAGSILGVFYCCCALGTWWAIRRKPRSPAIAIALAFPILVAPWFPIVPLNAMVFTVIPFAAGIYLAAKKRAWAALTMFVMCLVWHCIAHVYIDYWHQAFGSFTPWDFFG